jgi:lambda family phage portal protein
MFFGYKATEDKNRRKRPVYDTKGEDFQLDQRQRRKAIATQRDQHRNLAWVAWACRTHLDYVSEFKFRATSKDDTWNERFEKLIKEKSRKSNCDVAGRHSFGELMRIFELCKITDGDCALMKFRKNALLQAIESDRITKPISGAPNKDITEHGLVLDENGRTKWYAVNKRDKHDQMVFDKMVKAQNMFFDGYFTRFDQSRGISPLLAALNTNQDLAEAFEYTLIKTKFHAMLGMAIERDSSSNDDPWNHGSSTELNSNGQTGTKYNFEMQPGLKLELEPGDKVNMLESKTPNEEFVPYTDAMLRCALLALDIPFSFYSSQQFSYNAGRQDTIRYVKSAKQKQDKNRDVRDDITAWWLQEWLIAGDITLEEYNKAIDNGWRWQATGTPLIDPSKEVPAMAQSIANGLKSRSEFIDEMGGDFRETAQLLKMEEETFERLEIKGIGVGQPGQTIISQVDEEAEAAKGGRPPEDDSDDEMSADYFWHKGNVYHYNDEGILEIHDPNR